MVSYLGGKGMLLCCEGQWVLSRLRGKYCAVGKASAVEIVKKFLLCWGGKYCHIGEAVLLWWGGKCCRAGETTAVVVG